MPPAQIPKLSLRSIFELTGIVAICLSLVSMIGLPSAICFAMMAICLRLQLGLAALFSCGCGLITTGPGLLVGVYLALFISIWPLVSMNVWPVTIE